MLEIGNLCPVGPRGPGYGGQVKAGPAEEAGGAGRKGPPRAGRGSVKTAVGAPIRSRSHQSVTLHPGGPGWSELRIFRRAGGATKEEIRSMGTLNKAKWLWLRLPAWATPVPSSKATTSN